MWWGAAWPLGDRSAGPSGGPALGMRGVDGVVFSPVRQAEFAGYPLGPGEAYWLHRTGTAGTGAADRRDCHLWRWTGRQAALLQAFIREGGVSHFAPAQPRHDGH